MVTGTDVAACLAADAVIQGAVADSTDLFLFRHERLVQGLKGRISIGARTRCHGLDWSIRPDSSDPTMVYFQFRHQTTHNY